MKNVMCGTCGLEVDAATRDAADAEHLEFDPAHEASWYENDELVRRGDW